MFLGAVALKHKITAFLPVPSSAQCCTELIWAARGCWAVQPSRSLLAWGKISEVLPGLLWASLAVCCLKAVLAGPEALSPGLNSFLCYRGFELSC